MKKIITKLNNYFYQIAFAVLLFISFFIFKDFWVECLNKFWVDPIAEKINNNNIYIIPFAIIITYYIKQWIVTKTYNTKRLMFYIAFVVINVLCYFSGYWQYTSKWTTLLIILPLICEIILDVKIYCKRKFSKQITPELEIEKIKDCKDEYNRKTIYETTYNTLKTCFYEEGSFAVSISGAWGSGKTVFKEQLKKNYEKDNKVSIIEFEAWKCDSPTIIIRNFFTQLKDKLKIYFPNISIDFNNYIDLLLDNDSVKPLRVIAKGVNNLLNKDKDPFDTIKNYLKESKHKVVVFIDDVDRLDADEIKEVLRLVRNTANFPYIQFIVTCDNDYVCDTLKKKGIENPKLYLEKFFNLEISLPKFEERIICEELKSRISKTISDIWGIKENDIQIDKMIYYRYDEFTNNIKDCVLVNKVLLSMRDVIGFHNSFKLIAETYKNYENQTEIDFQDLFFLELLRYKFPKLHSALWDNTFDFLYLSQNYKQYILNDYFLRKREMIQQSRRNKKNNVPTIDIDSYKEKDEEFKQKIKNYINDNDDVEIPINILIYLFVRNKKTNNPIYKVDCFDRYFMYRLNEKVLTNSEFSIIIDKDNITIEEVDEMFDKKYYSQFEDRAEEILGQIFKNKDLEYNKPYNFIKRILKESNKPKLKTEISRAVLSYFENIPFYRDNEHFQATLDLYNYCDLESSDKNNSIFFNFLTTLLIKDNLKTRLFNYNEGTKKIIKDFLENTTQKISITQCLTTFIKHWGNEDAFKINCILSVEELKKIQLNYFKECKNKFSDEAIMLFENCWEKVDEYTHKVTLTDDALNTMKDAIKENPNGYFGIFIRHGNSSRLIGHIEIAPTLFYDDIFGEKEEFEQFLNSCNSNSIEETRVKNFWKLFKNNNYENLQFENQAINIQEIIDNCFGEQIKQLEELESIKQEIEKTGSISKESRDSFNQNPLKIALRHEINQKISGIKFIESIETDK